MKTLGYSNSSVTALVLGEALLVTALGGAIGLALAALLLDVHRQRGGAVLPGARHAAEHLRDRRGAVLVLGAVAAALPCAQACAAEDRRCIEEGVRWPATSLSQIAAITAMNLRNMRERADLVHRRAGRHRRRGHGAHRRAVDRAPAFARCSISPVQADVAIVLRSGATDEMGSSLLKAQTRIIADAKDIARDAEGAIASPELYVIVDVPLKRTGTAANVPLRGVGAAGGEAAAELPHRRGPQLHPRHVRSHRRPRREPAVRRAHRRQQAALGHDRLDRRRYLRGPRQRCRNRRSGPTPQSCRVPTTAATRISRCASGSPAPARSSRSRTR